MDKKEALIASSPVAVAKLVATYLYDSLIARNFCRLTHYAVAKTGFRRIDDGFFNKPQLS